MPVNKARIAGHFRIVLQLAHNPRVGAAELVPSLVSRDVQVGIARAPGFDSGIAHRHRARAGHPAAVVGLRESRRGDNRSQRSRRQSVNKSSHVSLLFRKFARDHGWSESRASFGPPAEAGIFEWTM